jgi:hypothetical protein
MVLRRWEPFRDVEGIWETRDRFLRIGLLTLIGAGWLTGARVI